MQIQNVLSSLTEKVMTKAQMVEIIASGKHMISYITSTVWMLHNTDGIED